MDKTLINQMNVNYSEKKVIQEKNPSFLTSQQDFPSHEEDFTSRNIREFYKTIEAKEKTQPETDCNNMNVITSLPKENENSLNQKREHFLVDYAEKEGVYYEAHFNEMVKFEENNENNQNEEWGGAMHIDNKASNSINTDSFCLYPKDPNLNQFDDFLSLQEEPKLNQYNDSPSLHQEEKKPNQSDSPSNKQKEQKPQSSSEQEPNDRNSNIKDDSGLNSYLSNITSETNISLANDTASKNFINEILVNKFEKETGKKIDFSSIIDISFLGKKREEKPKNIFNTTINKTKNNNKGRKKISEEKILLKDVEVIKNENPNESNSKFRDDNVSTKVRSNVINIAREIVNPDLQKSEQFKSDEEIKKIKYDVISKNNKKSFNLVLLNTKLSSIFSNEISDKYKLTEKNKNQKLIQKINESTENSLAKKILNSTFGEFLKMFFWGEGVIFDGYIKITGNDLIKKIIEKIADDEIKEKLKKKRDSNGKKVIDYDYKYSEEEVEEIFKESAYYIEVFIKKLYMFENDFIKKHERKIFIK